MDSQTDKQTNNNECPLEKTVAETKAVWVGASFAPGLWFEQSR